MSIVETLKKNADKAMAAVAGNADRVHDGIDKAAELADARTGGKHTTKINKAVGAAKGLVTKAEARSRGDDGESPVRSTEA